MTRVPPERGIASLAAGQHGVVARRQLEAVGVTLSMLRARLANGGLIELHSGVYAVGHRQLRTEGHRLAAVLALGPGAVLSHREAAALHGLRPSNRSRVDVMTTRRIRVRRPGIDMHHTATLDADDVVTIEAIPVTTVARTLVDLAHVVARDSLAKALREAEHLRVADLGEIHAAMDRTRHRPGPGHANLRAVLEEHRRRGIQLTRSILEDRFLKLCDRHGIPRPRTNAYVEGREVDALWPAHKLAVELDGWARHKDRHAFQRDREKGNAIMQAGYRLLRFTHDDVVRRPAATATQIAAFLAGA
jgi:very-short-patch-repair endonuclease